MKTKELINKLNGMPNIENFTGNLGIDVYNFKGKKIGWVSTNEFGLVDTSYTDLIDMKNEEEIVKLLFEYALTPLSEREDELKFRVKMPLGKINYATYLNQGKRNKDIFLDTPNEIGEVKTIFTKSEYDKLQRYYDWLPKFDEKDPHFELLEAEHD